jgi:hypothetical protein
MNRFGIRFVWGFVFLALLAEQTARSGVTYSTLEGPQPGGINYTFRVLAQYTQQAGDTNVITPFPWSASGSLLSVTNADTGEMMQFYTIPLSTNSQIFVVSAFIATDVYVPQNYTFVWSNYSVTWSFPIRPVFMAEPKGQAILSGNNATFSPLVYHCSGYQWQRNGTNLLENGHFIGVTNATLTISNAQPSDAGDYVVIAKHPTDPTPSVDAGVAVFKPFRLAMSPGAAAGGRYLQVSYQDNSPIASNDVPYFVIYSSTNLYRKPSDWTVESISGVLTNGIYQVYLPIDGSPAKFWNVGL